MWQWLTPLRLSPPGFASRRLLAALACAAFFTVFAGTAKADDLLVLNGDSETLSGSVQYGLVYIDGALRLAGDTAISASSIYIGPDAYLDTCFVAGTGDAGCTAGRSLTLRSSGPLTIATGIDLTGGTGSVQPGGNLTLSGTSVAVAGDVTTAGSGGAPSGQVSIASSGPLAVGGVYAPGAPASLNATGAIDISDGIQTQGNNLAISGNPSQVQSGGAVGVHSSAGNVRIGSISAYGGFAPTGGGLSGGNGAAVSITGSDVRTQDINTTGGNSAQGLPGASAPISISARGELDALGRIDASGQNGASGSGAAGSTVTFSASGPLTVGGDIDVSGGQSSAGGSIALGGGTVAADQLGAEGGDGSGAIPAAGPGGAIRVTAPNGASLGKLLAYGGRTVSGPAAHGGSINVTSSAGSLALESAESGGGAQDDGPGAAGGPTVLSAAANLSVGSNVDTSGSDANGSSDPPFTGANAGSLTLRAATGTLSIGGNTTAQGGSGSYPTTGALGGSGGAGGPTLVIAHAISTLASLSAAGGSGGDYGDSQGPGGRGGEILAFTDAPIFNSQQLVSSDGGDGNPTGVAGHQQQDSSPTVLTIAPSTGVLSFTSRSPDATRYRVLMSVAGAAPVTALTTRATTGLRPKAPVCQPVSFTVVAVDDNVGWTSDPSPAVSYRRPLSRSQGCSEAPKVTAAPALSRSLKALRRAHWMLTVPVKTSGIGRLQAILKRRKRGTLATVSLKLTSSGTHTLRLPLPATARTAGRYSVHVTTYSPDGKGHRETTFGLEVVS
jgi:hypothetical protein